MSTRQRYLICYDIANPKRLSRLQRYIAAQAVMLQYSVYLLYATDAERDALIAGIRQRINPHQDDVRIYPLPASPDYDAIGMAVEWLPAGDWLHGGD